MRAESAVDGVRRVTLLMAVGFALLIAGASATEARAAGPLSPVQTWTEQTPANHPQTQFSGSMVFDSSTGQTVLFGGSGVSAASNQTWVWDGADWTRKFPATSPFPRVGGAMAFDEKSGNVLLFGGTNTGADYNDTWSWDGTNWTQLSPATSPSSRHSAGMTYDSASGQIVLYGGARDTQSSGNGVYLNDTWTWNGSNWNQEAPVNQPPAGLASRMDFDPGLGRVMVHGIFNETTSYRQTWTWNGSNWSELVTATSPAIGNGSLMGYDPALGRMVLFGGVGVANSTWTFNGANWIQLTTPASPPARTMGAMSFDPAAGRMLLFGGYHGSGNRSDTWYFGPPPGVNSDWTEEEPAVSPPRRINSMMAFDPSTGKTVLFGGSTAGVPRNDTWTWDGSAWTQETPATSPAPREAASMAFDPQSGNVLMVGGRQGSAYTGQAWSWNGSNWTLLSPSTSLPARASAAMAFDAGSGEMVLFGGEFGTNRYDDTWIWTGNDWVQRSPANKPPARYYASMAFDQASGETVLFGGVGADSGYLGDTWTWNGSNWTQESPADHPSPLMGASMAFYPVSGHTMLFGGITGTGRDNPTWAWDGSNWHQQYPVDSPPLRYLASMDFDPTEGEMLLFGGGTDGGEVDDTWTYALKVAPPTVEISDPTFGQEIPVGSSHATAFSCQEAPGGPGLAGCVDEDGANAPAGQLDTSTAGEHLYIVTATSQNGQSGTAEIPYVVEKAEPQISVSSVPEAVVGDSVVVSSTLTGGYGPGGEITFRAYGPDDATCSGTPAFESSPVAVTGNDSYASTPGFVPEVGGAYRWVAEYSGDANNDDAESGCGEAGSVLTVAKQRPTLTTSSATDAETGSPITVKASLAGGHEPSGTVTFRVYGPDDANCSGSPAFESAAIPVDGAGSVDSPGFSPGAAGTYRWVASYSGDPGNDSAISECGTAGSVSTVTAPPPPPDVCPATTPGLRLVGFGLKPPFGSAAKVMGVRVAFISTDAVAKIQPSIGYRLEGRKRTVKLQARTLKVDGRRNLRFRVPAKMKKQFRKAGVRLGKSRVTFAVKVKIRPAAASDECFRSIGARKVKTRIAEVSGRVAFRRF